MAFDATNFLLGSQGQTPGSYNTPLQNNAQLVNGYTQGSQQAMGVAAPQMDPTQQAQFRAMQMAQAQQLQGVASGQQQGAGELAVQRQMANAQAAQQAQANMVRGGGNSGMAFRNAAVNQAGLAQSGVGQAQQAALSDQQAAQGQLANVTGQARTQDQSLAQNNAQLTQQQTAQNNQANLGYLNGLTGENQAMLNAQTSAYGASQANKGAAGGLINSAGSILGMISDRNAKTDIRDGGKDIDDMLDGLKAKTYRYKDERHGKGERPGIIAQDLEATRAGRDAVFDGPHGKTVDVNRALSAALAASARLNERMRKAGI